MRTTLSSSFSGAHIVCNAWTLPFSNISLLFLSSTLLDTPGATCSQCPCPEQGSRTDSLWGCCLCSEALSQSVILWNPAWQGGVSSSQHHLLFPGCPAHCDRAGWRRGTSRWEQWASWAQAWFWSPEVATDSVCSGSTQLLIILYRAKDLQWDRDCFHKCHQCRKKWVKARETPLLPELQGPGVHVCVWELCRVWTMLCSMAIFKHEALYLAFKTETGLSSVAKIAKNY